MQLFLFMPLLVLLFVSYRLTGYVTIVALWIASVSYGFYLAFSEGVSQTFNGQVGQVPDNTEYMVDYYLKVLTSKLHIQPLYHTELPLLCSRHALCLSCHVPLDRVLEPFPIRHGHGRSLSHA